MGSALGPDQYVSERPFEQVCREFLYEALRAGRLPADLRFARSGFSPKLRRRAADRSERILLFEANDLYW